MPRYLRALAHALLAPVLLFVSLSVLLSAPAQAQSSAAVTKGVSWLSSQVQGDGSLAGEAQAMATPMQTRADAALTLRQLSTLPPSIPANVAAIAENNTQYLARKVLVLGAAGTDTSSLVSLLAPLQNYDGGFGIAFGYSSDVVNTSWAVLALAQAGQGSSPAAVKARGFLLGQINPGGGVYDSTLAAQLYDSAIALQALETTPDNSNASSISNLESWLKMEQGTNGGWSGNTFLTAYALLAIAPVNSDSTINGNAANYLLAKQAGDGSWGDDPYLTAIVLRALSLQPANNAGQTAIEGQVVASATNLPLAGATITIVGGSASTVSDSNGNFALKGLTAGAYSVGIAASGYVGVTASASVAGGQTTNLGTIALNQTASSAIVSGQIVAAGSGTPLAGVTVSITGATTANAVTDSGGHYVITGVTPGAVTITASIPGYQTVTASTTLVAGQTVSFAPGLTPSGQTAPTGIVYSGNVISAGTHAALSGVTVQLSGSATATATTDANGNFSITLNPGTYSASFTLTGYTGQTQTFAAAAGTTVNGGTIALTPVLTSSTIQGQVLDASNQPIVGATVQIVGGAQATTASDGSYSIANVSGTNLTVQASATGYNTQVVNLQVPQPMVVAQNFSLEAQSAGNLSIGNLNVTPSSVGSNSKVTLSATVTNTAAGGTDAASAVVQLQVFDPSGTLLGTGSVFDAGGNQIGQVSLTPGQSINVSMLWNSGQFVPATYSLVARLVQVGSMTKSLPQGVQLAQAAASVTVTGQNHLSGSVAGNPPVLQTGTNTSVQFSATIKNDGNQPLAAQTYTLSVVNAADSSVATTLQASGAAMAVNAIQTLSFGSWQPTNGANYNLVVQPADPSLGSVSGTLYVGNASTATYTTDKQVVPTGTQKVRGTVQVLGQNVATGSINDPLAPLIKAAIQKSVTYNDATAAQWTQSNVCYGCHIQAQALVGGETNIALTTYNASQRDLIYRTITNRQHQNGAIYEDTDSSEFRTASMHGNWALDSYHDQGSVIALRVLGAQYLTSLQNSDGHWDYDRAWMGGWTSAMDHTAMNVKSLIGTIKTLSTYPVTNLPPTFQSGQYLPAYTGASHGVLIQDASGNLYVTYLNDSRVIQIKPDGTTGMQWTGLNNPGGLAMDKTGTGLFVATSSGLFHLTFDGQMTQVNSFADLGLMAFGPDGVLYSTSYPSNSVYRVDDAGNVTRMASVTNPGTIAFDANGNLLVPSVFTGQIMEVDKTSFATQVYFSTSLYTGSAISMIPYGDGWLIGAQSGIYSVDSYGNRIQTLSGACGNNVVVQPNGNIVSVCYGQGGMQSVSFTPRSFDQTAGIAQFDTAIGSGTQWMLSQSPSNNVALSHQLIGLGEADKYYANNAGLRTTIEAKMAAIATTLRANQNSDGGWGAAQGYGSDAFVTAHVGYALGYTNPSPTDPVIRNAVIWLLAQQQADGSWYSEDGIFSTHVATTTWVSIWLPQALSVIGGIDTDLSVTFPSNVVMSNPDTAPASVTPNADGTSTALWHLTGVTAAGQTVNYDLTLQNMLANETRAVSTDAHLTFNNSFTNGTVSAAIAIPNVTASAYLNLGLATDKNSYGANTLVNVTGSVANLAATVSSGNVKFDIVAPDGSEVASLGSMPFNQLAGDSSASLPMTWNTGNQAAAAGYSAVASLYDSAGTLVATAKASFAITASNSGAANATVSQSTDKQTYQPSDTVNLTDKLVSTSSNTALGPLTVTTTVVNASATSIFSKTESLPQLGAGAQKSYAYAIALHGAAAGNYQASVIVTDTNGNTVTQAQAAFTVASSATSGNGLTGTISVGSPQVQIGTPVTLTFSATNSGNSALANLPLTVTIVDPVAQKTIASYPTTQNIAIGANYAGSDNWTSAGTVGNNYVAVLSASVGGASITLAQTTFALIAPPYKLGSTQTLWNNNRVLVLTTCSDDDDDEHDDMQQAVMERKNQEGGGNGGSGASKACTSARYKAVDSALTTLGITHLMTTDSTSFTVAMRSGLYDTLWIAQEQSACGDDLTNEIIEVVYHGGTLIVDGNVAQDNLGFDRIGGVKSQLGWYGSYSQCGPGGQGSTQSVTFNGSFYGSAQTLTASGNFRSLTPLTGAAVEAVYSKLSKQPAAMVYDTYGAGRTLISGFDWGSSMAAAPSSQAAAWNGVLGATLAAIAPQATTTLTPGQYLPVQTVVTNQGSAVGVDVLSTLPQGAFYLGSIPSAKINTSANSADWDFNLAVSASQTLDIAMRAPATGGSYSMQTVISTVANGSTTAYGNPLSFPVTVIPAATHAANATADLQALSLSNKSDQSLRSKLVANLNQAMSDFNANTYNGYGKAIDELVEISDGVISFSSANATAQGQIRAEVDAILQEAQWRWSLLRPEVTSELDLDKSQCSPSDTVTLTASLTNVLPGTLTGLTVTTKVTDPTGALFLSKTESLPQLAAKASQSYRYPEPLKGAASGTYQVTLTVADVNGNVLSQSNGTFKVGSSSGSWGQGH